MTKAIESLNIQTLPTNIHNKGFCRIVENGKSVTPGQVVEVLKLAKFKHENESSTLDSLERAFFDAFYTDEDVLTLCEIINDFNSTSSSKEEVKLFDFYQD